MLGGIGLKKSNVIPLPTTRYNEAARQAEIIQKDEHYMDLLVEITLRQLGYPPAKWFQYSSSDLGALAKIHYSYLAERHNFKDY